MPYQQSRKVLAGSIFLLCGGLVLGGALWQHNREHAHADDISSGIGTVTITSITSDNDSVKVDFKPVPGAADYRIYQTDMPTMVKYAGQIHEDSGITYPSTEIEWNGLPDDGSGTWHFIVEAVNELGPVAACAQYDDNNAPTSSSPCILGNNFGPTTDGNSSINGQGPVTDNPQVIARSAVFTASPSTASPLLGNNQGFWDTFRTAGSSVTSVPYSLTDCSVGDCAEYQLNDSSDIGWNAFLQGADTTTSKPFFGHDHLMDVLFDGGTPGVDSNPPHVEHGVLAFVPNKTLDISGGQIAHLTMEVDGETTSRRALQLEFSPVSDPITDWYSAFDVPNASDRAVRMQIDNTSMQATLDVFAGYNADGSRKLDTIYGAAGQGDNYNGADSDPKGGARGLDNRTRFDLFVSQTHVQAYEDGVQIMDADIPAGEINYTDLQLDYAHLVYHSSLGQQELEQTEPNQTFWIDTFPYSDERHWDNLGAEVLPSDDWNAIAAREAVALVPFNLQTPSELVATTDLKSQRGNGNASEDDVSVTIKDHASGTTVYSTSSANIDSGGYLQLDSPDAVTALDDSATYDVYVKPPGFLNQELTGVTNILSAPITFPHPFYLGDLAGSSTANTVSLSDVVLAVNAYNRKASSQVVTEALGTSPTLIQIVNMIGNYKNHPSGDPLP